MNKTMDDFSNATLSPAGESRRAAILNLARGESRSRRQRRTGARAGVLIACIAIVMTAGRVAERKFLADRAFVVQSVPAKISKQLIASRSKVEYQWIQTDPTLLSRWAVAAEKPSWIVIKDDELLKGLAEAGKPAGLAYVDGRTVILFREMKNR